MKTREEIEKAWQEWQGPDRAVDFALAMVARHNEELAARWVEHYGFDKHGVAKYIRASCPK